MKNIKIRTLLATTAIAAVGILGVGNAAASGLTDTSVSIKGQNGDYYGYVHSSDPTQCENDRKVTVFKQLGSVQDPHADQKIGTEFRFLKVSQHHQHLGPVHRRRKMVEHQLVHGQR